MPEKGIDLEKDLVLTEKEHKQIELQRRLKFAKYEVHIEDGQPMRMTRIRESIKL